MPTDPLPLDLAIAAAHHARVPYQLPKSIHDSVGRHKRIAATVSLSVSYQNQVHSWLRDGQRFNVRMIVESTPGSHPAEDTILMTAWNPFGKPQTLSENEAATQRLERTVTDAGGTVTETIATTAADRSWLEDTLVIRGLPVDAGRLIAREYHQPALTSLGSAAMTIHPSTLLDLPAMHGRVAVSLAEPATCPMRSDHAPDALCTMHGGPWTSGAIHAAVIWKVHRSLLMSRLGCTPCDAGRGPTLGPLGRVGGPISIPRSQLILANRYGGYVWR